MKARDVFGHESDWSDSLLVNILGPKLEIESVSGGIKIKAKIINVGESTANDVNFSVSVKGGLLNKINSTYEGSLGDVGASDDRITDSNIVIGFGQIEINVKVASSNAESVEKTFKGFVFGPLIFGIK